MAARQGSMARRAALAALALGFSAALPAVAAEAPAPPSGAGFIIAPVVYYTPETDLAWGLVAIHYFRLDARRDTRLSHYRFNVIRTRKRQSIAQADFELYSPLGRYLLDGTAKYSYYPDRFYGIGNRSAEEGREDFTSQNWRLRLDLQRRWGRSFFAGLRLDLHAISMRQTEEGGLLASGGVSGGAGGSVSGLGLLLRWDSRDNTFSTRRGGYASLLLSRYLRFLGSDYRFGQLDVDARRYWPVSPRAVLAAQALFRAAWGDPPFQALPRFGGLNLLRGYFDGRYRDRIMLALQADWRHSLGRRLGLCAFAGLAQVQRRASRLELDGFHAAAGGGVRYKFNPRENLILRLDAGFAGGAPAFYLTFAEAF